MGMFDSIKKGIKKTAENVKEAYDQRQELLEKKRNALRLFKMDQLQKLCDDAGINRPLPYYENPLNRDRIKRIVDRNTYVNHIVSKVDLDLINEFASEHQIRISKDDKDIKEEPKVPVTVSEEPKSMKVVQTQEVSDFSNLLSYIETKYQKIIHDQTFSDEDQFTDNLVSALRSTFPDMQIENTRKLHRDSGDIFVEGKYVLELKFADTEGTLNKGLQESMRYREKNYPGVAFVILDVGQMQGKLPQYKRWYEGNGAKVIILLGKGVRKKPKKTYIFREK